jgi:hypothetical protein
MLEKLSALFDDHIPKSHRSRGIIGKDDIIVDAEGKRGHDRKGDVFR